MLPSVQCPTCNSTIRYAPTAVRNGCITCPKCNTRITVGVTENNTLPKMTLSFNDLGINPPQAPPVINGEKFTPSNNSVPVPPPLIPTAPATSPVEGRRLSPRQRRLVSDEQETKKFFNDFPLINVIECKGNPVNQYIIEYLVRGIEKLEHNTPVYRNRHLVEIVLDGAYPRTPPKCRMLTPIFHPNIEPAVICIGDHWTAQERLCHLIVRIGEIITYQSYNIHSPLDGLAAQWADLHSDYLPVDSRSLLPDF